MRTISATGNDARRSRGGFTLIELGVVVVILAFLMALAAPSFVRSYRSALVGEAARAFATVCQYARLNAVSRQRVAMVHLDLTKQTYWLTQRPDDPDKSDEPVTLKMVELNPRVILASVTLPGGETGARTDTEARVVELNFYPNGTCDGAMLVFRGREEKDTITLALDALTAHAAAVDTRK
jgi:prepilin-type N-terminal cleavage/methylation domain-containing protein